MVGLFVLIFLVISFAIALAITFVVRRYRRNGLEDAAFVGWLLAIWLIVMAAGVAFFYGWVFAAFRWG
jgi:hypothetical protein